MSLEILNAGEPFPEDGDFKRRFVPLPLAIGQKVVDTSTKTPTVIQEALERLWSGRMPGKTGLVITGPDGEEPDEALDLVAFRQTGRNQGVISPLPKDAIDNRTKRVQQGGVVFLTNTQGIFVPVARIHDRAIPGERIEADFLGLPRRTDKFAVQALSSLDIGVLETIDEDSKTGEISVQIPRHYV